MSSFLRLFDFLVLNVLNLTEWLDDYFAPFRWLQVIFQVYSLLNFPPYRFGWFRELPRVPATSTSFWDIVFAVLILEGILFPLRAGRVGIFTFSVTGLSLRGVSKSECYLVFA